MAFTVAKQFHLSGVTYDAGSRYRIGTGRHFAKRLGRLLRRGFLVDEPSADDPPQARAEAAVRTNPTRPSQRRDAKGCLMAKSDRREAGAPCKHKRTAGGTEVRA